MIPANPHPKQREIMVALGFQADEHLDHNGDVCWHHRGAHELLKCNVEIRLKAGEQVSAPLVIALVAHNARWQGRREVQDEIKKSLNLR